MLKTNSLILKELTGISLNMDNLTIPISSLSFYLLYALMQCLCLGSCFFFWLRDNLFYLKSRERDEDRHQRTEYVKEAIGQVGQSAYSKHGGLGHSARVPWYEHGGYSNRVLNSTAKQPALQSAALV